VEFNESTVQISKKEKYSWLGYVWICKYLQKGKLKGFKFKKVKNQKEQHYLLGETIYLERASFNDSNWLRARSAY